MKFLNFNLQWFGEGGGDGGADTGAIGGTAEATSVGETDAPKRTGRRNNPLADVKYGKQVLQDDNVADSQGKTPETMVTTKSSEQKATDFENLIKGEYKSEFDARVQNIINKRFGKAQQSEEQMKSLQPVLDMLSQKYGVDKGDLEGLSKAIQDDDAYYEEEALKKGLSVKQLKEMKKLERENEGLRRAQEEAQAKQQSQQIFSKWMQQTEEFNTKYGMNIDFGVEAMNPDFSAILKNGGSVESAYKAVHFDEMMGGAMFKTAQTVTEKMANQLQSKASRPLENGVSSRATATVKADVNKLTKADREEIERRAARGEIITF